jgi:hypothetical protein
MMRAMVTSVLLVLVAGAPALAQPLETYGPGGADPLVVAGALAPRRHDLRMNFGAFSAVGYAGVTYAYSPLAETQLELGAGYGMTGLQLSFMPKVSLGSERHRFVTGLGPSLGVERGGNSYWLNADLGYEYRSEGGFSFLVAGGLTYGIGGTSAAACLFECDGGRESVRGWLAPQARVAIGQWF